MMMAEMKTSPRGAWAAAQRTLRLKGLKCCSVCREIKPTDEFHRRSGGDGVRSHCKLCNHKLAIAGKYKLTPAQYSAMRAETCMICDAPAQHLDHDHATGQIRGGLCSRCNMALGLMDDDPQRLREAAKYLEYFNG